jgi:hypothetical protein
MAVDERELHKISVPRELIGIQPFLQVACGASVPIGGERRFGIFEFVWEGQECFGEEIVFYVCKLDVDVAWDTIKTLVAVSGV